MRRRSPSFINSIPIAVAGITLILVLVDFFLGLTVRSVQLEVNQRQQYINQTLQLNRVYEVLVRSLAQASVKDKEDRLRDLLTQNGITVNTGGTGASTAAPPASAPAAGLTTAPETVPAPVSSSKEK